MQNISFRLHRLSAGGPTETECYRARLWLHGSHRLELMVASGANAARRLVPPTTSATSDAQRSVTAAARGDGAMSDNDVESNAATGSARTTVVVPQSPGRPPHAQPCWVNRKPGPSRLTPTRTARLKRRPTYRRATQSRQARPPEHLAPASEAPAARRARTWQSPSVAEHGLATPPQSPPPWTRCGYTRAHAGRVCMPSLTTGSGHVHAGRGGPSSRTCAGRGIAPPGLLPGALQTLPQAGAHLPPWPVRRP